MMDLRVEAKALARKLQEQPEAAESIAFMFLRHTWVDGVRSMYDEMTLRTVDSVDSLANRYRGQA